MYSALPAYAELHCLSNFSFLRGASHPEELVQRALELGYAALAITDECSFAGVVRAPKPPKPVGVRPHIETGVDRATLDRIFQHLTAYPEGFTPHPKLMRQFEGRAKTYTETGEVEWATAEALAIGSLVQQGVPVRLAGEDSRRGTFSQRHAALVDYQNENVWIPLSTLPDRRANFWVYDKIGRAHV